MRITNLVIKHLESLQFDPTIVNFINCNNSETLVAIASNDVDKLKVCLDALLAWRHDTGDIRLPKCDNQKALEYFIKRMSTST